MLFEFDGDMAAFMQQAEAHRDDIDTDLLWEVSGDNEFTAEDGKPMSILVARRAKAKSQALTWPCTLLPLISTKKPKACSKPHLKKP